MWRGLFHNAARHAGIRKHVREGGQWVPTPGEAGGGEKKPAGETGAKPGGPEYVANTKTRLEAAVASLKDPELTGTDVSRVANGVMSAVDNLSSDRRLSEATRDKMEALSDKMFTVTDRLANTVNQTVRSPGGTVSVREGNAGMSLATASMKRSVGRLIEQGLDAVKRAEDELRGAEGERS